MIWMDGWVMVLRPFDSISVISRRWKGEHERLCAMKRRLGSGRISPPARFEPANPWSEVGSSNRSATRWFGLRANNIHWTNTMLKAYIHIHTHLHTRTFVSNDVKGLINSLESEGIHTFYVIWQSYTKLAMALVMFLSVLVIRVINDWTKIGRKMCRGPQFTLDLWCQISQSSVCLWFTLNFTAFQINLVSNLMNISLALIKIII